MNNDPVAVIGGADGPTSVFLSGNAADFVWLIIAVVAPVLIGVLVYLIRKRRKESSNE